MNTFNEGDIVSYENKPFRIITKNSRKVELIQVDIDKYNIVPMAWQIFDRYVKRNQICPCDYTTPEYHGPRTDEEREDMNRRMEMIEAILSSISPNIEHLQERKLVPEFEKYIIENHITRKSAIRHCRRYLQAGKDPKALLSLKRRLQTDEGSRNTENSTKNGEKSYREEAFEYGFALLEKREVGSIRKAYIQMLGEYYTLENDKLMSGYPSESSFYRYTLKERGGKSMKEYFHPRDHYNDDRSRPGTSSTGVVRPGQIAEVDGLEMGFELVAEEDRHQCVGKAHVHVVRDVATGTVISAVADFETNSILAFMNMMAPVFLGRSKFSEEGRTIVPMGFIPEIIRCDHGSEFISNRLRSFAKENRMAIQLVSVGMGSEKGLVESANHSVEREFCSICRKYGAVINKDAESGKENACMTIHSFREVLSLFPAYFNQRINSEIVLTPDQVKAGCLKTASDLWDYGIMKYGSPRWVAEDRKKDVLYSMLETSKANVNLTGLRIDHLQFFSKDKEFIDFLEKAHRKHIRSVDILYDPRKIDSVFLELNGVITEIPLSEDNDVMQTYKGMSWERYRDIAKESQKRQQKQNKQQLENEIAFTKSTRKTAEQEKILQGKGRNSKKDIRPARRKEREKDRTENALGNLVAGIADQLSGRPAAAQTIRIPGETQKEPKTEPECISDMPEEALIRRFYGKK